MSQQKRKPEAHKPNPLPKNGSARSADKNPKAKVATPFAALERSVWPYVVVVLLGFLLYVNTVPHRYAFDDSIVVTENAFTKRGLAGIPDILSTDFLMGMWGREMKMYEGGRYRPLSLVTLAIEYQFFGENPHVSHFINALLNALTAFLLYLVMQKLFGLHHWEFPKRLPWWVSLPFIITALYIAHPIHTEVVANIKGRDEQMAFLGMLAAWWYSLRFWETKHWKHLGWAALMLFLGMLSKEGAVTFLAVIPLSLYVFARADKRSIALVTGALFVATVLFLRIRWGVLGGLPDNDIPPTLLTDSFIGLDTAQRYATIFYTFGVYLKLLFFPHPLTYDYYPYYIPVMQFGQWQVWLSILVHGALGLYALLRLQARSVFAFGVLFFWITFSVYSNLLFSIGVFMSERFVYGPSLGFVMALVAGVAFVGERFTQSARYTSMVLAGFGLMLLGFGVKTVHRNLAWADSFTLFTTDGKVSGSTSFKSAAGAGELLLFKARKTENETERKLYYDQAIEYFETVLRIFPDYIYVVQYMGDAQLERHQDYQRALDYWAKVFVYRPDYTDTYRRIERLFELYPIDKIDADFRIAYWERIRSTNPECARRFEVNANLGRLYGAFKNNLPKAIEHLRLAEQAMPNDANLQADLGVAYSLSRQFDKARTALELATRLQPANKQNWNNLAAVYQALGLTQQALQAQQRAAQ